MSETKIVSYGHFLVEYELSKPHPNLSLKPGQRLVTDSGQTLVQTFKQALHPSPSHQQ